LGMVGNLRESSGLDLTTDDDQTADN
jgi:hypothetical protein